MDPASLEVYSDNRSEVKAHGLGGSSVALASRRFKGLVLTD